MWQCPIGLWREVKFEIHGLENQILSSALYPSLRREDVMWFIASFLFTSVACTQRFSNKIKVWGGTVHKNYQIEHIKWLDFYDI